MKKIIVAAAISMVALVGCTQQSEPTPSVTITEQVPLPTPAPLNTDDGAVTNSQEFINFVRENGGLYGGVANEKDIFAIGYTICEALAEGISEDEITYILAKSLVENNMGNDDGAEFGAALIVGAKNYLCGAQIF